MATHGTFAQFEAGKESWSTYVSRLNHYFIANDVNDAGKKRSILLSICGSATFQLIRSLMPEAEIDDAPYADLVALVKGYYEPTPSKIVQRYKFNTRVRSSGESIAAFVAALREIAQHCGYGDSLSEMLRDRLVCGVQHDGIQKKLLATKNLTYTQAFDYATSMEAAERDARQLRWPQEQQNTGQGLNYAGARDRGEINSKYRPVTTGRVECYRCGENHLAPDCKFKEAICRYCKKRDTL